MPTDDTPLPRSLNRTKKLSHSLLLWFLLLSLLPLGFVSWFSYQQASHSLRMAAVEQLEYSADLKLKFVESWLQGRLNDLSVQAASKANARLLVSLSEGLQSSDLVLKDYISSADWLERVDGEGTNLPNLMERYSHIYDLLLVDTHGNILYTVLQESDIGTSLIDGPYARTKFSQTVLNSLDIGTSLFSGMELYSPSGDEVAAFVSAPLRDTTGSIVGAFAIQMRMDQIYNHLAFQSTNDHAIHQYLVSADGVLLSPMFNTWDGILQRKLTTEPILRFNDSHEDEHFVGEYIGPDGRLVIGVRQRISILGQQWLLISEIDSEDTLASVNWLAQLMLLAFVITAGVVAALAFFIAGKITQPVRSLAAAALLVAEGKGSQDIVRESDDELGQLADAFNHMMGARRAHETMLERRTAEAQQALVELHQQKFALDQHSIVAITDIRGTITYVNTLFCDISGYSDSELLGENHRLLNSDHHPDKFFRDMYLTISGGQVWHGEICNKNKAGELYWVDTTISPYENVKGEISGYIAIRTDITNIKETAVELAEAKTAAESAALAKSEFLASMSHEIRTPMNGVLGMLSLLLNMSLTEEQARRAQLAKGSAESLLGLINDILDFSRVEAGKLDLEVLDFNPGYLLAEFVESMALRAEEKRLELVIDLSDLDHCLVQGDPGRIRQILSNLVGNAIKFTEQGEVLIRATLRPATGRNVVLACSIEDTGIGIPAERIDYLFDKFTQVDASTTRKFGGSGLGLSIAKQLCQLMKGDIWVESKEGQGSKFRFEVTLEISDSEVSKAPNIDIRKLHILLVDDNNTNLEVVSAQLRNWGAEVVEVISGEAAISILNERAQGRLPSFDLAILDMQMPNMDGAQLAQRIRTDARFESMKLVMMTSMAHRGDAQFFADIGFDAYFPKPVTTQDLLKSLTVVGAAEGHHKPLMTRHSIEAISVAPSEDTGAPKDDDSPTLKRVTPVATKSAEVTLVDGPSLKREGRILLVEDNIVNQEVALGILEDLGYQADIANDGKEAIECLINVASIEPYQLVLMDCQMPVMDGYKATREIRKGQAGKANQHIPIVAMTANAMKGDREKCIAAGMSDYLSKPIDESALEATIHEWLQSTRSKSPRGENGSISVVDDLPVWDRDEVLARLRGREERLNKIVGMFDNDAGIYLTAIDDAFKRRDSAALAEQGHALKGVAATLAAKRLEQAVLALEVMGLTASLNGNDWMAGEHLLSRLHTEYEAFSREIKS